MGDRIVVMKDGVVQQIDAPLKLYHEPVNLFVASFLGSPAMNFIHGKLKAEGDGVVFHERGDGVIKVPFKNRPELKDYSGKDIVLGIRPEEIEYLDETIRPVGCRFQALVDLVEPMGAETNYYLQTGEHSLICRSMMAQEHRQADGHRMQFELDPAKAHLFDPETTLRIRPS